VTSLFYSILLVKQDSFCLFDYNLLFIYNSKLAFWEVVTFFGYKMGKLQASTAAAGGDNKEIQLITEAKHSREPPDIRVTSCYIYCSRQLLVNANC